ncbi:hypothetical protein L596_016856 [Steinernema carpocapsae]|uniref:Acyltransferase 3 domain-containing protein n=1 Tax=Steinernema carpocapsae TaxID=34508 RepID=A0A4U5NKF6_STECR|nr:hypothetical protein L596_016856 [Steinernema carpocapsae]
MPASCSPNEIAITLNALNSLISQATNGTVAGNEVCSVSCRISDPPSRDVTFWVVTAIMIFVSAMVMLSSHASPAHFLDLHERSRAFGYKESRRTDRRYPLHQILLSVLGHYRPLCPPKSADNFLVSRDIPNWFFNYIMLNGFFCVDSFFFLSGLLLSYLFFKEIFRNPNRLRNPMTWVLFYVRRFLRLTPSYMMFIAFYVAYLKHLTIGPIELYEDRQVNNCVENWWTNLLYVSNICYLATWYLAADMQMYVFSPILLIALAINQWVVTAIGIMAISIGANYGTFYKYHFYPTLLHVPGINDDPKAGNEREFKLFNYHAAWIRCLPYIVGIMTGYYLQKFKNKRIKVHPVGAITGWALATACALGSLFGIFNYMNGSTDWSVFTRASYNNFSRLGWGLSLAFVVVACQKGFGGPIKNIMSLKIFTPLGRLSYCAYLVHIMIIYIFLGMWRQPLHYVSIFENYVHMGVACIVISYLFAMVWSLMFEIPFGKLEKMLIEGLMGFFVKRSKRVYQCKDPKEAGSGCKDKIDPKMA